MLASILMTQQLRLLITQSCHVEVLLGQTPRRMCRPMVPYRFIALTQINKSAVSLLQGCERGKRPYIFEFRMMIPDLAFHPHKQYKIL